MVKEKEIMSLLAADFPEPGRKHFQGVADLAGELALKEGISRKKARIAGLLHDYGRLLDTGELRKLAGRSSWEIDEYEIKIPVLLHAPVGADLVKKRLGINDYDILEAIRFHTTGSPEMGKLAEIIYIADILEPGRDFPGVDKLRKKLNTGLSTALIDICDQTIMYNIKKGRIIHPRTLLLRNKYLGGN